MKMKILYIEILLAIFITFVYCDCNSFKESYNNEDDHVNECVENENGDIKNLTIYSGNLNEALNKIGSLVSLEQLYIDTYDTEADLTPLKNLKNLVEFTLDGVYDFYHKDRNTITKSCFSEFKNLKKLSLSDWLFSEDALKDFKTLKNLENLIYYGLVHPDVLEAFGSLSSVKTIYIYTRASEEAIDLSPLHKLEKLEKLEFECRVHKVRSVGYGFANNTLGGLKHLKTLSLYGFSFDDYTAVDISNMPSIEEIEFNRCAYTQAANFESLVKINDHLKTLVFDGYKFFKSRALTEFPAITSLTNLKKLVIDDTSITNIPEEIGNLKNLEHLVLSSSDFQEIPSSIKNLKKLKYLDLSLNELTALPTGLSNKIEHLDISNNNILTLPSDFNKLKNIQYLSLSNNGAITNLNLLKNLKKIQTLHLESLELKEIPSWLKNLKQLEFLNLSYNEISTVSSSIGDLVNLTTLDLSKNLISTLPSNIKKLTKLLYLHISGNSLTTVPKYVKNLKNLIDLNVDGNVIDTIPDFIAEMKSLKALSMDDNKITTIPTSLSKLKTLEELYLNYNEISELPNIFKNMKNIKAIELRNNKFTIYPLSICEIKTKSQLSFEIAYNHIVNDTVPECYSELQNFNDFSQSE